MTLGKLIRIYPWRCLFFFLWWASVIGLFALQSHQYHEAIQHSDRNRCVQSQHVWDVAKEIRLIITQPPLPLTPDQAADRVVAERHALAVSQRLTQSTQLAAQIGPRPTC